MFAQLCRDYCAGPPLIRAVCFSSGMAGALRLVPPRPPPPPGRAPVTALTADLWPEAEPAQGPVAEGESWGAAVTAVTALSAHLLALLDAICPGSAGRRPTDHSSLVTVTGDR